MKLSTRSPSSRIHHLSKPVHHPRSLSFIHQIQLFQFIIHLLHHSLVFAIRSFEDGSTAIPFLPTVVPLAVRSPYLGTYLQDGHDKDLTEMSPRFWTGTPIGWTGLIRIDGHVFNWMGNLTHWPPANNTEFELTASSSKFTFTVGLPQNEEGEAEQQEMGPPMIKLIANFISPMSPNDPFRQSLPLSYLSLTVESLDQDSHQVEIYTDINGLWCTDDESLQVEWSTYSKDFDNHHTPDDDHRQTSIPRPGFKSMEIKLLDQQKFVEVQDRIQHGSVWYSSTNLDDDLIQTTNTAGQDSNLTRTQFSNLGRLDFPINNTFRSIRTREDNHHDHDDQDQDPTDQDNQKRHDIGEAEIIDEPVLAWSHSFGYVNSKRSLNSRTVLMSIGHVRSPLVQYMTSDEKVVELEPLWSSRFKNVTSMIEFHLNDFYHVSASSQRWDSQLMLDSMRVQDRNYGEILSISSRQIFMAMESTRADYETSKTQDQDQDREDDHSILIDGTSSMLMLKEISSNGNCQTMDVIAPMIPFLIYSNPALISQILEPILRYVSTGLYKPKPTPHDLGDHYPNATGRNDYIYSNLPLEESGNILSILLACLRLKSCLTQVKSYYHLLTQWADWLIENTLYPDDQRSTDDFFGPTPNQTSLVVKGILGLRSMSEISFSLGQTNDSMRYENKAIEFSKQFLDLAVSPDRTHLLGFYGNESSWSTQYNLYFDRLFDFKLFPDWLYDMQDKWYLTKAEQGGFGPPLDSRSENRAKTDWLMWAAGASKSNETRSMFVDGVYRYLRQTNNMVFGDLISLDGGWSVGFLTRPVVGGHFSLLGLERMKAEPSLMNSKKLFGSLDVQELINRLGRQKDRVLGYGRTPDGQKLIISLGFFFLIFFSYRILSRYLNHRKSRKSKELYRSVVENYGDDDDDDEDDRDREGNDEEAGAGYLSKVRRRSKSLLRSLRSSSHHTHNLIFNDEDDGQDASRNVKLFEIGSARSRGASRAMNMNTDQGEESNVGLLSRGNRGTEEEEEEELDKGSSRLIIPLRQTDSHFKLTDASDYDDDDDDDPNSNPRPRSHSLRSQADWDLGLQPNDPIKPQIS